MLRDRDARLSTLCVLACGATLGCSGAQPEGRPAGDPADESFTRWSLPGVTLSRSCSREDDDESCGVWGRDDASGSRLSGAELFGRLPADLNAAALAERAQDLLLGASGEPVLTPESAADLAFVSPEERSIVSVPRLDDGTLVFFVLAGEMRPTATEIRIPRATGAVSRRPVIELWVEEAPAAETPLCLPVANCGCEAGCAAVDRVAMPNGSDRYRRLDGRAPRVLYQVEETGSLEALNQPCTEACPPRPASYACENASGTCEQRTSPAAPSAPG